MDTPRLKELLTAYREQQCSPEEVEELYSLVQQAWNNTPTSPEIEAVDWEKMFITIIAQPSQQEQEPAVIRPIRPVRKLWWAAAAVIITIGIGIGIYYGGGNKPQPGGNTAQVVVAKDAKPGKQGAILTLANGQQVLLDSMPNGLIAKQGKADVVMNNGQVKYENNDQGTDLNALNTMSTPRGRQFQLTLPDGTQVWLNSASSITYPTAFTGSERKVQITGEAYFEVAKDRNKPFRVSFPGSNGENGTVEVLGTHFNINAYPDESAARTTLLEGSVKVSAGKNEWKIAPSQQAVLKVSPVGGDLEGAVVNGVDVQQVIAWKNGYFNFNRADLATVMRQLARWYDVDVEYQGKVPNIMFIGEMQRNLNLSEVLDVLKRTDVHYKIEGKKLIVLP